MTRDVHEPRERPEPPPAHPAAIDPQALLRECDTLHHRTRGPGGQRRNKVETAVKIRHRPTGLIGSANERREQAQNHRVALFRLRVNLALEVRQPADPARPPTALWRSRVRVPRHPTSPNDPTAPERRPLGSLGVPHPAATGRIEVNPEHHDFPALLAEALDVIAACGDDLGNAAAWLGISSSQLVKFLGLEPRALAAVNHCRQLRGLRPMK